MATVHGKSNAWSIEFYNFIHGPAALLLHTDSLHCCCCYTHPCLLLPTSEHTADGLLPCLATDLGLDALVLLLGNLFAHLPIAGISTQDVRVEDGDAPERDAHRLSKEVLECPGNAAHEDVECEAPNGIEEKSKIHGNHHAEELQLRFQDANKKTSARGVDGQNPHRRRGELSLIHISEPTRRS